MRPGCPARIGGAVDVRELRCIVAVADAGSFSRAAEKLFVTRQAVAKTVACVEAETAMRVFERRGGRTVPTERGADLVADARRVVALFDEAIGPYLTLPDYARASRRRAAPRSQLKIVFVTGLGRWGMPPHFFERLRAKYPNTMLSAEEMSSDAVIDAVASGDADLGIAATHPDLVPGLECQMIFGGAVWVVMLEDHPLVARERLTLADLDGQPFVTGGPHDHCHRFILGRCREAGFSPTVVGNATDAETIGQLMEEYGALCPASDPAVVEFPSRLVARVVEVPGAEGFGTYLLRNPTRQLGPEARGVWEGAARP